MAMYDLPRWPSSYAELAIRYGKPVEEATVLIVEDESALTHLMSKSMRKMGYEVVVATDGGEAIESVRRHDVDLIVLDLMLPAMDGYQVCREIRRFSGVPIIIMTALNRTEDIVQGLEAGADDYMIKPFPFSDLAARIYALLRRAYWSKTERAVPERTVQLHADDRSVTISDRHVQLSPTEYKLLHCLVQSADQVVSRETLLMQVWGYLPPGKASILHTTIRRLREKVELDPEEPDHIVTVSGVGYKFSPQTG